MKKYRLIKEYPGSLPLGVIVEEQPYYFGNYICKGLDFHGNKITKEIERNYVENHPEFWEEIVEKDYEILSFIRNDKSVSNASGCIKRKNKKGLFEWDITDTKDCENDLSLKNGFDIHSIKRLSDGEVFTVGDKALTKSSNYGNITEFQLKHNQIYISTEKGDNRCVLKDLKKIKKPLFTTEDGVDIFEGDTYYRVVQDNISTLRIGTRHINAYAFAKFFSTKEAAEEYVLMNKPCLSVNDLEMLRTTYVKNNIGVELVKKARRLVISKIHANR